MNKTERISVRFVSRAEDWLADLGRQRMGGILRRMILQILEFFILTIEDMIGKTLFLDAPSGWSDYPLIDSPEIGSLVRKTADMGFISGLHIGSAMPDQPKIFTAQAKFGELIDRSDAGASMLKKNSGASGADLFNQETAILRCLGEAIERTCQSFYREEDIIFGSYGELGNMALDPGSFTAFSKTQLSGAEFEKFKVDNNMSIGWVQGKSLLSGKKILLPAQLVYLGYRKKHPEEYCIRFAISTGAAAHTDPDEALYSGICEVVERDAFMIYYLNKISPPILDLENSSDGELRNIAAKFRRYDLDIYVLDITTDIPMPVFAVLLIDRTGIGPAVVVSTKAGFDVKDTILGCVSEALKSYSGRRISMANLADPEHMISGAAEISNIRDHGLLWALPAMTGHIDFFTKGAKKQIAREVSQPKGRERMERALEYFKKNNMEVVVADITIEEAHKIGFCTKMVLIPEMHPLYHNEKFRYFGGSRLFTVPRRLGYAHAPKNESELNQITHPHS